MATSTKRQDYLGRWLDNARPGTTDPAKDFMGRACAASADYLGRATAFNNPGAWGNGATKSAGDYVKALAGTNYDLVAVALDGGTTGALEPTWPALYGTVVDNPGASAITWKVVHG